MSDLASKLLALRREKGVTQKVLAKSLSLSERGYQKLEHGTTTPTIETVTKLCDYYNVSSEYLLGYTDDPKGLWTEGFFSAMNDTAKKMKEKSEISDAELAIIEKLRALPPEKQQIVESLLNQL